MSFDPWVLESGPELTHKFRPSLVARAQKRTVRLSPTGSSWSVGGLSGEMFESYKVWRPEGSKNYECECYQTQHGDTRRRRMCSHVLAVVLSRPKITKITKINDSTNGNGKEAISERITVGEGDGNDTIHNHVSHEGDGQTELQIIPNPPTVDSQSGIPDVDDPMFGSVPFPEWMTEIRPHQWDAVQEILEAFDRGVFNVWLDAPTGSGKTLIGEMVRRLLKTRALYVCSGKTLQQQFLNDYSYSKVLMGKSNYPTELMPEPYNAGDCTGPGCGWCEEMSHCPYQRAKREAIQSPIAILNTSYLLAEANYVGDVVKNPGLVVLDECDVLERELMGFVEFSVGDRMLRDLGLKAPKKGSHKQTIQDWMSDDLPGAIKHAMRPDNKLFQVGDELERNRRRMRLQQLAQKATMVAGQIHLDEWIRDNDAGPLVMKPVKVSSYGEQYLWRHSKRWLSMSATIISPDELCDSLGLGIDRCEVVRVPMTFPVENRRINVVPVANMVAKEKDTAWPKMAEAIAGVLRLHPDERVLVHCVSYDLAGYLAARLQEAGWGRRIVTYTNSRERDTALAEFRTTGAGVLLASSMDRGVDLKDDDCRVVVVAKVPWPYLGDKQVSARMHMQNGQSWYSVQTVRTIVQMTGRAVRSAEDHATTYILDRNFMSNLYKRNKSLFPKWWLDAVNLSFPTRTLM